MIILFGVIATAVSVLYARETFEGLIGEYESKATAIATSIADVAVELSASRDVETLQATIDMFAEIDGVSFVAVEDETTIFVAHTFVPEVPPDLLEIEISDGLSSVSELEIEGLGHTLHVVMPILGGLAGRVHVGMDVARIERQIWSSIARIQRLIFLIFAASVGVAPLLVRRITSPLEQLTEHTRAIASAGLEGKFEGAMDVADLHASSELQELGRAIASMESDLQESVRKLEAATVLRERLESELRIARDIQTSMLPKPLDPKLGRLRCEISASMQPAREVGGDLYDYFLVSEDALYFAVGDVSGKGVPASLFMTMTSTLLRAAAQEVRDPADVLAEINRELSRENDACMFVTLFLGLLDLRSGRLRYSNGGHPAPYLLSREHAPRLLPGSGVLLGFGESTKFEGHEVVLEPSDRVFVFSDGVTEAIDPTGRFFGDDGLQQVLRAESSGDVVSLDHAVLEAVSRFSAGAPPFDDITVLSLCYRSQIGRHGDDQ
jgi:sigma-B regulation protein RsbU (phosphoserine phosphatase)